jgi:hypothetical protein
MRPPVASLPPWRVALGFIAGPAVAAVVFSIFSPLGAPGRQGVPELIGETVVVLIVVYPITLVLGGPAYIVLKSRLRPSLLNCALVGSGVAVLPWLLISLITPNEESVGKIVLVHDHVRTLAGWVELIRYLGPIALLGALAGLVFWACVTLGRKAEFSAAELAAVFSEADAPPGTPSAPRP